MSRRSSKSSLSSPIIRPSARDFEAQLFGRSMSPDTVGELLSSGARGALNDQNDLFNLMEDTWPRLRANLQKVKNAIRKLPLNVQPFTPKNGRPSASAQEKADFIQAALRVHSGYADTSRHPLGTAVYELMDAVARGISVIEIEWSTTTDGFLLPVEYRRVATRYLGIDPAGSLALRLPPSPTSSGFYTSSVSSASSPTSPFSKYPHKFLIGTFRSKSGALGEIAQLRALAPLWLGAMLGWEWLVQKAELFGTPLRWATYPVTATQTEIDAITASLRNLGAAAWGAFPQGTNLQILQGSVAGVAGSNEPSERLLALADRACDILFLGQNLTSEMNGEGSRAAAQVHREVELDLYETYAEFIISILNEQLIPALIELNWGSLDEVPFVDVEINRPQRDEEMARRDQLLFQEMGLPVSLQYLYERHRIPAPDPGAALFQPPPAPPPPTTASAPIDRPPPTVSPTTASPSTVSPSTVSPSTVSPDCTCGCTSIAARSETSAELLERQRAAAEAFPALLAAAEAANEYLVWESVLDDNTTQVCRERHGRRWGDGWFDPPPAHFNCRSALGSIPKSQYSGQKPHTVSFQTK